MQAGLQCHYDSFPKLKSSVPDNKSRDTWRTRQIYISLQCNLIYRAGSEFHNVIYLWHKLSWIMSNSVWQHQQYFWDEGWRLYLIIWCLSRRKVHSVIFFLIKKVTSLTKWMELNGTLKTIFEMTFIYMKETLQSYQYPYQRWFILFYMYFQYFLFYLQ